MCYSLLHCTPTDSSADSSSSSSSRDPNLAAAEAAAAAAADAQLRKTANQFGALLANVADAPRQRYSLAGLGFGLPLSRLHARYFGALLILSSLASVRSLACMSSLACGGRVYLRVLLLEGCYLFYSLRHL
jgi:hypothetical protein